VNEFVRRDVKNQRNKLDEGTASLDGTQNAVVLEAYPVEMEALQRIFLRTRLKGILAKMRKGSFVHFVIIELCKGPQIISAHTPLPWSDAEMPPREALRIRECPRDTGSFLGTEIPWYTHLSTRVLVFFPPFYYRSLLPDVNQSLPEKTIPSDRLRSPPGRPFNHHAR
jgi:hypothetical protein